MNRVVKFEAAAGSGKTHQLTLEYLRRIFLLFKEKNVTRGTEHIERILGSILAITFTNKAANEMKERILGKLKKFALYAKGFPLSLQDRKVMSELAGTLHMSEGSISELSGLIIEIIISHYNDFNVKTIDSLMSSIIKVISPDLNLPPDFEIGVDAGDRVREGARCFIENVSQTNWKFMEEVLENIKNSESFYIWNVDETIVDYIVKFYEIALNRGDMEWVSEKDVIQNLFGTYETFKKNLMGLLFLIQEKNEDGIISVYVNKGMVNKTLVSAFQDFIDGDKNLKKITPIISRAFFQTGDPIRSLKKDAPEIYREKFTRSFKKTREQLSEFIFWVSLNRVHHFSQFLSDFIRFWEEEREKIFVSEFSRTIQKKLLAWEKSSLPYIYLKLSDRFRHFLFDEFQDTSELQFKALVPILEEVLVSDEKSSLFIVGDRKQAIYRWRGGNADLMNEQRLKNELNILQLIAPHEFTRPLDQNWRSRHCIVEFNNRFWESKNLRLLLESIGCPVNLTGIVLSNFSNATQELPENSDRENGFVDIPIHFLDKSKKIPVSDRERILHQKCLDIIKLLAKKGYQGSDIAILTRSNREGRDMVRALAEENIATISDESLFLFSAKIINEIISFFRFIEYPPDNLAFYTFISGDIFNTEARKRFPEEMGDFDESFFLNLQESSLLYKRFKKLYPNSWSALIEPFFRQAGFYPPYDIFQDITQVFQLYENFPLSAAFLLSFGSILHKLEQEEINSTSSFLAEWEKNLNSKNPYAIDMSDDESRIKVLTIHKAKGLEFRVVIIPILDKTIRGDNNLFWEDNHFFHITKEFANINPRLKEIYRNEKERDFIDELNLFYVAMTRAKDALFIPVVYQLPSTPIRIDEFKRFKDFSEIIVYSPLVKDKLGSGDLKKLSGCWEECSFGKLLQRNDISDQESPVLNILSTRSKGLSTSAWEREFLVFSASELFSDEEQRAMERGEAIHRVLAKVDCFNTRGEIIDTLKPLMENENLTEDDIRLLSSFLKEEAVFPFFQGEMEILNEIEVAGMLNGGMEYRRIDRLVIKGDDVFIIDFKTGHQEKAEYVQQIKEYQTIVAPLFPGKQIRGYLLFVDIGVVEEIEC